MFKDVYFSVCICFLIVSVISCKTQSPVDITSTEEISLFALAYGSYDTEPGKSWVRIVDAFEKENPGINILYKLYEFETYHQLVEEEDIQIDLSEYVMEKPSNR